MEARLFASHSRPALRLERRLAHPPEKVWRALTERPHLEKWFPGPFTGDLVAGGVILFDPPGHGTPALEGRVLEVDPPRVLAFTWDTDVLRLELVPDGAGCVLVLEHTFDERPDAASFAAGWQTCFDALEAVVAGGPAAEAGPIWQTRHEHWVGALGLDAGWTEPAPGGRTTVRFARPLTAPQPEVEPLLDELGAPGLPGAEAALTMVDGPGGNARLVVEHTLPAGVDAQAALEAWAAYVAAVAARLPGAGQS
jgi:uncharacterized protein YndB with AHSA1/START domain